MAGDARTQAKNSTSPGSGVAQDAPAARRRGPGRSIKRQLVVLFLLLAATLAAVFIFGAQRAFSVGWREAARPVLQDYVDRLHVEIAGLDASVSASSIERAKALTQRLPITIRIEGPTVKWASHPMAELRRRGAFDDRGDWDSVLARQTPDGHRITLGIDNTAVARRQGQFGWALAALLLLTLAAYLVVRRLLKPLDDIRAGAQRFGRGDFDARIAVRHTTRPDELDQLAHTVNTMADDIGQMLEAKRALLLAISHELRSPLTRARLNVELLPEAADTAVQRRALLRDLQEMATLVSDLLESERLADRHATLHREPSDLYALTTEVTTELCDRHPQASEITVHVPSKLPLMALDRTRVRLLLRNLLDNALRHGAGALHAPEVLLQAAANGGIVIEVRDHGPGVADDQLSRLADAFYRPDSARTRTAGGVGLGLFLCRLVAKAHGGTLTLHHANPGLAVRVVLPQPEAAP